MADGNKIWYQAGTKERDRMIRIVLVDDNLHLTGVLEQFFQDKPDIEVAGIASDGWAGLELIEKEKPDVVLLDMVMPRLDGLGVLDRLQKLAVVQPKIIMLTAFFNESMIQRAIRKGAVDYLIKPFELECIYERIRDVAGLYPEMVMEAGAVMGSMALADPPAVYHMHTVNTIPGRRKPVEVEITALLHDMGVPAHVKGYQYLRDAILLILDNKKLLNGITKHLYPKIAEKYSTTASRVERAIRHAIELAWDRGNVDLMTEYFGYSINLDKGKPTNSEFIAMVSDRIRLNY